MNFDLPLEWWVNWFCF